MMVKRSHSKWPIGESLTLRVPIVQAQLGSCDGPRLAAAVSRAGGLGCLTVHATPEPVLSRRLSLIRSLTRRPVLIAFTCQWQRDAVLRLCLDQGFRHFQVFWWNGPRLARQIHEGGGTVFWQVGTLQQAMEALECGADVLIAQGTDAGGQVRTPHPISELVAMIRELSNDSVPIVAGGGLANARDVAHVLSLGASAASLGTRFLLSEESNASLRHKRRLLRARAEDLLLDARLVGDWPCAPRRRLLTARHEDTASLFAGEGLSRINTLLPAAEIVRRLLPKT